MRRLLLALLAFSLLLGTAPALASSPDGPRVTTDATRVSVGERVSFEVSGFRADRVQVELCGSRGVVSSSDCDVAGGALAVLSGEERTGTATITVSAPPGACPCRVRAVGLGTRERALVPLAVLGVARREQPRAAVAQQAPPSVAVSVAVAGPDGVGDRLRGWLGLDDRRDVRVAVRNTGTEPLTGADVVLRVGRDVTDAVEAATVALPDIVPGAEAAVSVSIELSSALAAGRYVVVGEVDGAATGGTFGTQTSTMPVLLVALVLAVALGVALSAGRRLARRRAAARGRTPRPLGLPWLVAVAVSALTIGSGLLVQTWWTERADQRTVAGAQDDLLDQFDRADLAAAVTGSRAGRPAVRDSQPATGDLVAVLRLPEGSTGVEQTWAVVEGVAPRELGRAPGHYPGTAWPGQVGNSVIVGHSGIPDAPFDDLPALQAGDTVTVETAQRSWRYTVTGVREVEATATDVLLPVRSRPGVEPTTAQLTLITCAYEQGVVTGRWVIEAVLAAPGTDPDGAAA